MNTSRPESRIRFGKFELDLHSGELRRQGHKIRIQPQPMKVLAVLLEHPGELVTREELRKRLWPGEMYVDFDRGLNRSINKLRRALLDDASSPVYIETLSTRGYRFIAPIDQLGSEADFAGATVRPESSSTTADQTRANGDADVPTKLLGPITQSEETARALRTHPRSRSRVLRIVAVALALVAVATLSLRLSSNVHRQTQRARVSSVETRRFVYVADYSGNAILAFTVDPSSGTLRPVPSNPFKTGEHPYSLSFVGDYLYSANRGRSDETCGQGCNISAYVVDGVSGGLVQLDASPFPAGMGPLTVLAHPSGKFLYSINVISGDLRAYSRSSDGVLQSLGSPIPLGRHPINASLAPSGRYLYVSNQDDSNISAFRVGTDGEPHAIPGSPFATGLRPRSIAIDPAERHLYVLNYGVNPLLDRREACIGEYAGIKGKGCSISAFSIDGTGALSELPGSPFESDGINPHGSVIDSMGRHLFVANVTSNDVSVFTIDPVTGVLHPSKGSPFPVGEGPNALALDWSDSYLYVLNGFSRDITQFSIDDDGRLTPMNPSIPAGLGPEAIVAVRKIDK